MQAYHNSFYAMGTRFNAVFAYEDEGICESAFQLINTETLRIEKRLNYFDAASDISKVNNSAYNKSVTLDDELFAILNCCAEYSALTKGAFDITMRSLKEASQGAGYKYLTQQEKVVLNKENKTLRLADRNIKIDLGGFGKGYALEKSKELLDGTPVKNGIISFGESSVYAYGKHPCGDDWLIGVKDLFDPQKSVLEVALSNKAISVSSNYFVDDNSKLINKNHIVNPLNLDYTEGVKIIVVSSRSALQAEILSTAFMNMQESDITPLLKQSDDASAAIIIYNNEEPIIKQL